MSKKKVLVVDDEKPVRDLLSSYLVSEGYAVAVEEDGPSGLARALAWHPDMIVLDIMLPGMDGLSFLSQLRRESDVYVILLTARTEETDKIVGLSVGADDYVTKPFSPREVVARAKAAFRRLDKTIRSDERTILEAGYLRIDIGSRKVWWRDAPVELTTIEFDILATLTENAGLVLSRAQIIERVWGHDYYGEERLVDVHVGHIRQKIGADQPIVTVRGVGYRLEEAP